MESKKLICIEVSTDQLDALEDLLMTKLTAEEITSLKKKLLPLWQSMVDEYEKESVTVEILKLVEENKRLSFRIGTMKAQVQLARDLSKYAGANFGAVAADLILNPEPVEIPCSEKGKRLNFMISLNNVLAVESRGRIKRIYLREPIIPKEGGLSHYFVETNSGGLNFETLLRKLQKNRQHIMRVSTSYALNIFQYTLSETKVFHIIDKPENDLYGAIAEITADKIFNQDAYHKQLWEVDYMYKYRSKFAFHQQKMDEITRYMDSQAVTNDF